MKVLLPLRCLGDDGDSDEVVFPFRLPLMKNFLSSRLPVINTFTQSL